jgi:hypothetical protein
MTMPRTPSAAFVLPPLLPSALAAALVLSPACSRPPIELRYLDPETGIAVSHPEGWRIETAESNGARYRYLRAPRLPSDSAAVTLTFIPPADGSPDDLATPYLAGGTNVLRTPDSTGVQWTFMDPAGAESRLVLRSSAGKTFGGWIRGSFPDARASTLERVIRSLDAALPASWPEETYGSTSARIPADWTRRSRMTNHLGSSMQFRSPPLGLDRGATTVHGFLTVSTEPVPSPGDAEAFYKLIKDRLSDTIVLLRHERWRTTGWADLARSGTTVSQTRVRRWIDAAHSRGLIVTCESRADVFDRLEPWCVRIADTAALR